MATLDMKTSAICRSMDGKHFPIDEAMPGVNYPPMHPRCRSTTITYRENKDGKTRTARSEDGKSYDVPLDMNYEEWHKTYVENDPEYLAKEKAWKNRHGDRKKYENYIEAIGKKNVPSSFDSFQKLKYNNTKEWEQLKHYKRSIKSGELTSFADFKLYKDVSKEIDEKLIGLKTSDGVVINKKSKHFINRVIGSVEQKRNGVDIEHAIRILSTPDDIKRLKHSTRYSIMGVGSVSVNPKTGKLIQVNPLGGRKKND